jgi:O-6-methylguanine DNA methyltransferase
VRAATDPTTNDIVAFGDEICCSAEAEVWERGAEISHERLDVRVSATGLVQRILQEHVRCPIPYGELADLLGNRLAIRAVGLANGGNPISIIIPCHRVVGGNGSLTGYAGGLERKRRLLELEAAT